MHFSHFSSSQNPTLPIIEQKQSINDSSEHLIPTIITIAVMGHDSFLLTQY